MIILKWSCISALNWRWYQAASFGNRPPFSFMYKICYTKYKIVNETWHWYYAGKTWRHIWHSRSLRIWRFSEAWLHKQILENIFLHINAFLANVLFHPSKHFNVGSTLLLDWYDVATSHNVKSTLKQRCVCQRWNLQRRTKLKQHCVFHRWTEQRWQRRNNVVIFNVDFHNVGQRRNDVANMTIWKKI